VLVLLVAAVLAASSCGIPTDDGPKSLAIPVDLSPTTGPAAVTTTIPPQEPTDDWTIFLVNDDRLQRVPRALPAGETFYLDVMAQLTSGPTADDQGAGLTTAIPVGTEVLRTTVDGSGVVTVDLNEAFRQGAEGAQRNLATAQLVYTATAMTAANLVRFRENGQWIQLADAAGTLQPLGANGVPEPLSRVDFLRFITDS
jgi:hypothetical protein